MIPLGTPHALKDSEGSPAVAFSGLEAGSGGTGSRPTITFGGDGPTTGLLTGEFLFESPLAPAALAGMDPIIFARADGGEEDGTLEPVLRLLCREQRSDLPGSRAATDELVKLLFLQTLRAYMARQRRESGACKGNALALLFDPSLRAVGELVHRFPQRPWTVAELAKEAHMSRTSFAVKFAEVAGMSPFAYLTHVRMINAIELLSTTAWTLEKVADQVGYGSEAAFSAAFKREIGVAPGAYRRSRLPGAASFPLGVPRMNGP